MVRDWQRLDLYLDISKSGFFVVELSEVKTLQKVLSKIKNKKTALIVDFAKVTTDYYNENFVKGKFDCVVFYNLEYCTNAFDIIESFNMNRDNFANNDAMYIFILPKYLSNYLIVRTPNLHSYITSRIDLSRVYEPPFRPLLSLDNFVIDKKQIQEEKRARREFRTSQGALSYSELFNNVEFYKYNRASAKDLVNLLESAGDIYNYECSMSPWEERNKNNLEKFYIEFTKVAFYQGRYDIAEYTSMMALGFFVDLPMDNFIDYKKYSEENIKYRSWVYVMLNQTFSEVVLTFVQVLQMIDVLRVLAATVFYQKDYFTALDWFNLINTVIAHYAERGFLMEDVTCLNFCDIALCCYKLHDDQINDRSVFYFDKALQIREKSELDIKTLFVLDYNDLVYKIKGENVRFEDYNFSSCRAQYYKSVCSERSSIFASYLSLVAWAHGCLDGNVEDALKLNRQALELKRMVLTENHYSIAESHYCNAVLYFMKGEMDKSHICLNKALKILKVYEKKNHTLIEILTRFRRYYEGRSG